MKGEPLQSLGLAKSVGFALLFEGPSPSGSYVRKVPLGSEAPERVDSRSTRAALAWARGVFSVKPKPAVRLPGYVRAWLAKRKRGWYTLGVYTPLKVVRYLISLDVKRLAYFQSIWCCNYKLLTRHPSIEFSNLIRTFDDTLERPMVAKKPKNFGLSQSFLASLEEVANMPSPTESEFLAQQEAWAGGSDSEEESEED